MSQLNLSEFLVNLDRLSDQLGYKLISKTKINEIKNQLEKGSSAIRDIDIISLIKEKNRNKFIKYLKYSKSQLRQDLFVLCEHDFKQNGYFIEFGAADGILGSNSYLLEKQFNWDGILCEPGKYAKDALKNNRSVVIEQKCVWESSSEEILFNETEEKLLSTIDSFSKSDNHSEARKKGKRYNVETISLLDLLNKNKAPKVIDYLSIDTEGSEFKILNKFDFNQYKFKVITCEHNFTSSRDKIFNLLTANGYKRKWEHISNFDDWYVLEMF